MGLLPLLLSFKGRIGRRPYIFAAAPILLIFELAPFWAGHQLPRLMQRLGYDLIDMWLPLTAILTASYLLLVPLLAVSFKRLHDLGRSGLWSLPYLCSLAPPVAIFVAFFAFGEMFLLREHAWLKYALIIARYYGLALALALAVLPSRSAAAAAPAS